MPGAIIFGIALLAALIFFLRWYSTASVKSVWRVVKWAGLAIAFAIIGYLILRGGIQFIWMALAFLVPWILRLRGIRNWAKAAKAKKGGQISTVRTRFVAMELDHDSGEMNGDILEGSHAGSRLSDLNLSSLLDFYFLALREDQQSAQVLESYLDHVHGEEWRNIATGAGHTQDDTSTRQAHSQMSKEEAFEVLGLRPGASDNEIKAAHRKLIREYHPDKGGSSYLAAKINEAKDLLLKG